MPVRSHWETPTFTWMAIWKTQQILSWKDSLVLLEETQCMHYQLPPRTLSHRNNWVAPKPKKSFLPRQLSVFTSSNRTGSSTVLMPVGACPRDNIWLLRTRRQQHWRVSWSLMSRCNWCWMQNIPKIILDIYLEYCWDWDRLPGRVKMSSVFAWFK